jgi:hypothetical protein
MINSRHARKKVDLASRSPKAHYGFSAVDGPGPIEVLGARLTVENQPQPTAAAASSRRQ